MFRKVFVSATLALTVTAERWLQDDLVLSPEQLAHRAAEKAKGAAMTAAIAKEKMELLQISERQIKATQEDLIASRCLVTKPVRRSQYWNLKPVWGNLENERLEFQAAQRTQKVNNIRHRSQPFIENFCIAEAQYDLECFEYGTRRANKKYADVWAMLDKDGDG